MYLKVNTFTSKKSVTFGLFSQMFTYLYCIYIFFHTSTCNLTIPITLSVIKFIVRTSGEQSSNLNQSDVIQASPSCRLPAPSALQIQLPVNPQSFSLSLSQPAPLICLTLSITFHSSLDSHAFRFAQASQTVPLTALDPPSASCSLLRHRVLLAWCAQNWEVKVFRKEKSNSERWRENRNMWGDFWGW